MAQDDATYTKPKLRAKLKKQIQADGKGGKPGQWSARKAQLLVRRYEKEGGGYATSRRGSQEHLKEWGEQDWTGGSRYLPEIAWKLLSAKERKATEAKKKRGDGQYVANTRPAKEARKAAELLTMKAGEARKAVRKMDGERQLRRARAAEKRHGKGRRTVLAAIEERLDRS